MVKAVWSAARSVGFTLVLLGICLYVSELKQKLFCRFGFTSRCTAARAYPLVPQPQPAPAGLSGREVFAIAFRTTLPRESSNVGELYFRNVPAAMHTLFVQGTLLDSISELFNDMINEEEWAGLIILYVFIIISAVTVMNMLIGVLCVPGIASPGLFCRLIVVCTGPGKRVLILLLCSDTSLHANS